ncbi:hypothetical protein M422DRAFT_39917, partial [Sphaerobolus stellatus SS14]
PKYIASLLESAATRRLDHLRAEEKMIQREREAEGDEFAEKESFVTQAYKDQVAELRRAEEEEKRLEAEKKKKGPTMGMARFYQELLQRSEAQHQATVEATTHDPKPVIGPAGPNLTITKPPDFKPKSDLEIAREAEAQGKTVELNDDNQIVDKRELLSAGLNLSLPNTRNLGGLRKSRETAKSEEEVQAHRAVGTAASLKEINQRRQREIEKQLEEERERRAAEKERADREEKERVVAKRNNQEEIEDAKARYLARKRQRLEKTATTGAE